MTTRSTQKDEPKIETTAAPTADPTPAPLPTPLQFVFLVRDALPFMRAKHRDWTSELELIPALVVSRTEATFRVRPIGEHGLYPSLELSLLDSSAWRLS